MRAQVLAPTAANLKQVASHLSSGALAAIPTETVYGLAGDGFNSQALAKIFATKERPTFDPLILHFSRATKNLKALSQSSVIDTAIMRPLAIERAEALIEKFWPGPLTLVLPKSPQVPDLATSGMATVAVRMPAHPVAQELLALCNFPLAAPSANRFGKISPTHVEHVLSELGDRIDYVVDGGPCQVGIESTIVSIGASGELTLLRPGGLAIEQIESLLGVSCVNMPESVNQGKGGLMAPGMLTQHYSPTKPMYFLNSSIDQVICAPQEIRDFSRIGLLMISGNAELGQSKLEELSGKPVIAKVLSPSGDMAEAAHTLFTQMRALDASSAEVILTEPCSTRLGLGYAIQDRLTRACARGNSDA